MDNMAMPQVPLNGQKFSLLKILLYVVLIGIILYYGRDLFIPLSFSFFISFILYPICQWLENHGFNRAMGIFVCISLLLALVFTILFLLGQQLISFSIEWVSLKTKLHETLNELSRFLAERLNIDKEEQLSWLKNIRNDSSTGTLSFLKDTLYSSGVGLVLVILIPIFSALILYYRTMFVNVLYLLFAPEKKAVIHKILHLSVNTYYNFIKGMAIVYLIVGILNSLGLWIIGIPHPFLFGFIASVFTVIPYIGIIVAAIFPITVSWLTYSSIWYPIGVILIFTFVQYLEANLIFPMAVSSKLNLNTFVTIIMIIAGGILWGAAGMILFIPYLAIVKLIADNTEELKALSIFLGTKNS
jgi:predicted PurR-regulated permease PerM